jgi:PleD family two-component response regulator
LAVGFLGVRLVSARRQLQVANVQLEALSRQDGLTGLTNRRHFDEQHEVEHRRAVRTGNPLALLMIDVDYFKCYNDHYGHDAGDMCLYQLANIFGSGSVITDTSEVVVGDETFEDDLVHFIRLGEGQGFANKTR